MEGDGIDVAVVDALIFALLLLVFTASLLFTIYLAYDTTNSVPTDILVLRQRELKANNEKFDPVWHDTGLPMDLYCNICDSYVQERTKHCGSCNRCCEEFDHHCNWLNNCIGTANYKNFRRLINAYFLFKMSSLLLFVHLLAKGMVKEEETESESVVILLWLQFAINIIAILFVTQLIYFHIWLVSKGINTFEYITYRREVSSKKAQLKVSSTSPLTRFVYNRKERSRRWTLRIGSRLLLTRFRGTERVRRKRCLSRKTPEPSFENRSNHTLITRTLRAV